MISFVDLTGSLGQKIRHDNLRLVGEMPDFRPGLDGQEQVVFSENRIWRGSIVFPPMFGTELARLRSVPTRLKGRAGVMRIPLLNVASPQFLGSEQAFFAALGVTASELARGQTSYGDGSLHSDGSGFALPDARPEILTVDLDEGSTAVSFSSFIGRSLAVGDRFSIDAKLYEVEENEDGAVRFAPPLRAAASAGAVVRVSEPHIDVRLASKADWTVFANLGIYSEPLTVNVVEAFDR